MRLVAAGELGGSVHRLIWFSHRKITSEAQVLPTQEMIEAERERDIPLQAQISKIHISHALWQLSFC